MTSLAIVTEMGYAKHLRKKLWLYLKNIEFIYNYVVNERYRAEELCNF